MKDSNKISKFDPPSEHESSIVTLEQPNGDVHEYQYHSRQPFKEDGIYRPQQTFKYIFVCGNPDCGGFVELYKPSFIGKNQLTIYSVYDIGNVSYSHRVYGNP